MKKLLKEIWVALRFKRNDIKFLCWLFGISGVASILFYNLEKIYLSNIYFSVKGWGILFILLFFIIWFFIYIFDLHKYLNIQCLRQQYSWFLFLLFVVSLVFWTTALYSYFIEGISIYIIIKIFFIIFIWGIYIFKSITLKKGFDEKLIFAVGAVGIEGDELSMKNKVAAEQKKLDDLLNPVNIVGLYGGLGTGKSSYARMLVEKFLEEESILYTYLSLTETDEERDLSRLFQDRWYDTLSLKYPMLNINKILPLLRNILRDTHYNTQWLANILTFFYKPLFKTKSQIGKNKKYVSNRVAELFGNIPEIQEKNWIILIDEVERAKLEEVYKLIEIIERLKQEGQYGLPVKIIFILCISDVDLQRNLDKQRPNNHLAQLIYQFFYDDIKCIDHKIILPVDPKIKQQYIINNFRRIKNQTTEVDVEMNCLEVKFEINRDLVEETESWDILYTILSDEPIRVLEKIFQNVGRFLFKLNITSSVLVVDLLIMEYIKIKYVFVFDFLFKTIGIFSSRESVEQTRSLLRQKQYNKKGEKHGLWHWIKEECDLSSSILEKFDKQDGGEKTILYQLFRIIGKEYLDLLMTENDITDNEYFKSNRLINPKNMKKYLNLINDSKLNLSENVILSDKNKKISNIRNNKEDL